MGVVRKSSQFFFRCLAGDFKCLPATLTFSITFPERQPGYVEPNFREELVGLNSNTIGYGKTVEYQILTWAPSSSGSPN